MQKKNCIAERKKMEQKKEITDLISKYLENKCDERELTELVELFQEDEYQQNIERLLFEYWQRTPSFQNTIPKSELDEMLNSIHHQINLQSKETVGVIRKLANYAVRVAAILFIPLLIGSVWMVSQNSAYNNSDEMITLETPYGSKLKTTLPDGTEVWQNAGTTLKYPARFTKRNRKVELVGEAYFHVSSDKGNPFYVETNDGTVKVTGTRFNVSAFPDDDFYSVVLEEGKVAFQPENSKPLIHLAPKEKITVNRVSETIQKQKTDVEKSISWINGKLIFRNDPLGVVVKRLERWYNADIVLNDPDGSLSKHQLTITVQNETLRQVLDYITEAISLNLEVEGSALNANSTFIKTKYIVSKKYN